MSIFNSSRQMTVMKFVISPGRKIYIGTATGGAGNDTTGDGSEAAPYATLTKAWTDVRSGANDIMILRQAVAHSDLVLLEDKNDWMLQCIGAGVISPATNHATAQAHTTGTAADGITRLSSTEIQVNYTAAHGFSVGNRIYIANATQSGDVRVNGVWDISVVNTANRITCTRGPAVGGAANAPYNVGTNQGFTMGVALTISKCNNFIIDGLYMQSNLFTDGAAILCLSGGTTNFAGGRCLISNCIFGPVGALAFHTIPNTANVFNGGFGFRIENNYWNRNDTSVIQANCRFIPNVHLLGAADVMFSENRFSYLDLIGGAINQSTPPIRIGNEPLFGMLFTQNVFASNLAAGTIVTNDLGMATTKYSFLRNRFEVSPTASTVQLDSGAFLTDTDHQQVIGQDYLYGDNISNRLIVNRVWDEPQSSHTTAGTFGKYLDTEVSGRLSTTAFDTKIGTPAGASVSVDVASVKTDTNSLNATKITTARANNLDNLDATISSRESESSASTRASTDQTEHDATQSAIAALNNLSSAQVQTAAQAALTAQGYTTARAPNLDNLDATVSSRESESSASTRATTNQTEHDATQTAIGNLNDLSSTEVENAVWDAVLSSHQTAGSTGEALENADAVSSPSAIADAVLDEIISGHTTPGSVGVALANLDATVSSRESESSASSRASTNQTEHDATQSAIAGLPLAPSAASIADAVWDETLSTHLLAGSTGEKLNSGNPINVQDIVDGVLDEATSAHTDSGSVGEAIGRLDVTVSSRESESSAASRASADIAEHDTTQAAIAALSDFTIIKENFVEGTVEESNITGVVESDGPLIGIVEDI